MYKLAHVGMAVSDCERSAEFYRKVLECEMVDRFEDDKLKIICMKMEEAVLELIQHKNFPGEYRPAGPVDHLAITVNDIKAEIARLKAMGINCLSDQPREVLDGKKIIFFTGPDGEKLELVE